MKNKYISPHIHTSEDTTRRQPYVISQEKGPYQELDFAGTVILNLQTTEPRNKCFITTARASEWCLDREGDGDARDSKTLSPHSHFLTPKQHYCCISLNPCYVNICLPSWNRASTVPQPSHSGSTPNSSQDTSTPV